jgi:catechol 2,3-dioxygenase-like lactoylglutathione lyase family enzyme
VLGGDGGAALSLQLVVADLDTTEAFYAGILELPVQRAFTSPGAPNYLLLPLGDFTLIFVDEEAVLQNHPILEERFSLYPKGVGMTFHFPVRGIEGMYAALLEEEMKILYPLEQKPYGIKELWCFDPDGYLVVLEEPTP